VIVLRNFGHSWLAAALTTACRTPVKRQVLNRLPPSTLDLLAMTCCDDGALLHCSIEQCPNDPEMLILKTLTRLTALHSMGWTGFNSGQL